MLRQYNWLRFFVVLFGLIGLACGNNGYGDYSNPKHNPARTGGKGLTYQKERDPSRMMGSSWPILSKTKDDKKDIMKMASSESKAGLSFDDGREKSMMMGDKMDSMMYDMTGGKMDGRMDGKMGGMMSTKMRKRRKYSMMVHKVYGSHNYHHQNYYIFGHHHKKMKCDYCEEGKGKGKGKGGRIPTTTPSLAPTVSGLPSISPTRSLPPSAANTAVVTTTIPTSQASRPPSRTPTGSPLILTEPTGLPSSLPTYLPTGQAVTLSPSVSSSSAPITNLPTPAASASSIVPSVTTSSTPTSLGSSAEPTAAPSSVPSGSPTAVATPIPSSLPTAAPTAIASGSPSVATPAPSMSPSVLPTPVASGSPTAIPTALASGSPTQRPAGPVRLRVRNYYMAYRVPNLLVEPTAQEYNNLLNSTETYFDANFTAIFSNFSNITYEGVNMVINRALYNQSLPNSSYTVFINYNTTLNFAEGSDLQTLSGGDLFTIMSRLVTPYYILSYVRPVTPFQSTMEVIFRALETVVVPP